MVDNGGVIQTNNDATTSKWSAIKLGYWADEFIKPFVTEAARRSPLINRGYYARVMAFRIVVEKFLARCGGEGQIVSLGAGFDTLYWRLLRDGLAFEGYYEVDFPEVVSMKEQAIPHSKGVRRLLKRREKPPPPHRLVGADLRDVDAVAKGLADAGLLPSKPTLFMAECVMVYLEPEHAASLVEWAGKFSTSCFVNYEQILPNDAFGQVMVHNLKRRGCSLKGLEACPTLESQRERFLTHGWASCEALDMNGVFARLPSADVLRIQKLEMLDELEEWRLISAHYCFTVACSDALGLGLDAVRLVEADAKAAPPAVLPL